ncbi:MAG: hypothetical protein ABIJ31_08990 [Pseudomonadota bacterium]
MKNLNDKALFLGIVTASVTHEIQNVFAIIKETSGLMEDFIKMNQAGGLPDIEDKLAKCLETIKSQAYRGVKLTSGLNGFAHTPDNTLCSINVIESIEKILAVTDRIFKLKNVTVSVIGCNTPCSIVTDPVMFQMAVFSCLECLVDLFNKPDTISMEIKTLENQTALQFSCSQSLLKEEGYQEKLNQNRHWITTCNLCQQINLKAKLSSSTPPNILMFLP